MCRAQALPLLLSAAALAPIAPSLAAGALRGSGQVSTAEAESSLLAELAGRVGGQRLQELEAALRPMYAALPKGERGHLGHQAVRYALHRLLLQRHGWYIVGLEPSEEGRPPYLAGEWVPEYLQGLLEQRLGGGGLDLHEIAALAATLEDLVRAEAGRRVDVLYEQLHLSPSTRMNVTEADHLLETYMMMHLDNGNFSAEGLDVNVMLEVFKKEYTDWEAAASWMQQIKGRHLSSSADGKLGREGLSAVADELGERFGAFNDGECRSLKRELLGLEGPRPGRVPLLEFYKKGLYSHWQFNEKVEYLRALGALDESDELRPAVVLPNYLGSRPNCLAASGLYAVCCRNECEDLMAHLERDIAGPTAAPERIQALVSQLASDTVNASRELPTGLVQRLHEIAARHGGEVPLHGRLFAQWMHHAYPRECPFPHEGGAGPQTPDEWMKEASEEELREMLGACAAKDSEVPCGPPALEGDAKELPWSEAEVLLDAPRRQDAGPSAWMLLPLLLPVIPATLGLLSLRAWGDPAESLDLLGGEPSKPAFGAQRPARVKVFLSFLAAGAVLEFVGVLDRFTLGCALAGGLLINLALPLLVRRAAPSLKAVKSME